MALRNYLAPKTYSTIDGIQYVKNQHIRFSLKIFDENKQIELATKYIEVSSNANYKAIVDFLSEPPLNPVKNAFYIVNPSPKAVGEWKEREGLLAILNNKGFWDFWMLGPDEIFYNAKDDYYFRFGPNLEMLRVYPTNDYRLWDKFFAHSLVISDSSNIFKQAYKYLKTCPGFENVTDA